MVEDIKNTQASASAEGKNERNNNSGQAAHDIFVSYSTRDKPVADAIVARLEQAGIRCWVAPRDIVPGSVFGEAIIQAIETSRLMVVVFSGEVNQSRHVYREVERAVAHDVVVIPFRIESVEPSGALAYFLASEHWLDAMTPPLDAHIAQLVTVARALLHHVQPRPPAPPAPPGPPSPARGRRRRRVPALIAAASLAVLGIGAALLFAVISPGGSPKGNTTASSASPSGARSAALPPASAATLARALLTPKDLSSLGHLVIQQQENGTSANTTGSGLLSSYVGYEMTFVSGDPGCAGVLKYHPETAQAWASEVMGDKATVQGSTISVGEDIESFPRPAEAQRVMQENRDQLANCHKFVAVNKGDNKRYTFTHQAVSVPSMGQETVAHQLNGEAGNSALVLNEVEIRSGADVIFILYAPAIAGTGDTAAITSAAWHKYSIARR